ncbi:outer membrane protein [Rhodopseudomonas palustris]|uniref:Porin family protein n=1 Tax=Rhodopseudomonas palustris TaxID=1076 RepID=A0A418V1W7_RHOPL|nr:outer membrane protein [Rhodopseudomonas palustris]RJF69912.1 porin family protein [Rhodopseudomonas palustris]
MKRLLLTGVAAVAFAVPAVAADLAPRPYKAPPPLVVAYNWTGFYLGANAGYGWGTGDTNYDPLPNPVAFIDLAPTTLGLKPKGALAGGQAGYNWQSGAFVGGLEADIQWSDIRADAIVTPIIANNLAPFGAGSYLATSEKIKWFGTVRGRAGFTATDTLLLYATGGLAYGEVEYAANTSFLPIGTIQYPTSFSKTKVGWTVGAGAEWAFAPNWSAKLEYLHYDLGNESTIANPIPANPPFQVAYDWKTSGDLVRVGINYRWGGPILAKY